jgi:signal transduction histidine kinase
MWSLSLSKRRKSSKKTADRSLRRLSERFFQLLISYAFALGCRLLSIDFLTNTYNIFLRGKKELIQTSENRQSSSIQYDFSVVDKKKFELSTRVLRPALLYIEKKYKREFLLRFVMETGMDISYLEDEKNWISFEYYNLFLEKLVRFTKNPSSVFESGEQILSGKAYGAVYSLLIVLKIFGTPNMVIERIVEFSSALTNIAKLEIIQSFKNRMILKITMNEGYDQTRLACDAIKGQLVSIPRFWGFPPARIKEIRCAAEGAESCILEINWLTRPLRNLVFYVFGAAVLIGEILYYIFANVKFFSIKDIILSGIVVASGLVVNKLYEARRLIVEYKKIQEERTRSLEVALNTSRNEYVKLQEANLQIVEKSNKMSILNYIAEEMSKVGQEGELLGLIVKIIVDCIGFDRGYYICFTNNYESRSEPVFVEKIRKNDDSDAESFNLAKEKLGSHKLFKNKRPQIIAARDLFDTKYEHDILCIPISVYNNFIYLLCFDNYVSKSKIREKNMQFFWTVSRQVEISLNNIYAIKSAHNVLSSIPSSIVVFDKNSLLISYVNSAYLKNFNVNIDDVLAENVLSFLKIADGYKPIFLLQIEETAKRNFLYDQELQSGSHTLGYTLFKMPEGAGGKNEIGMIMKDITEQKEFQEQLIRGEKLAALGTLASGIAHEINNPLYGVLGTAEVIVDEAGSDDLKKLANEIIDYTMQASDIVKDLSAYSRNLRDEKPKDVNINEVMEETIKMVSYSPQFIDIKIEKDLKDVPTIYAIGGEIRQVYMNIVNNAIQAMDGRGKLKLTSELCEDYIVTTIEDSGPGIPQGIISKIFDPFFTTKPPGEGTGIGLNIVYRIVTKYNGFISVSSKLGQGTAFTIKFHVSREKE